MAEAFAHIGQDSLDAALRFLRAAEKTFEQIAMMPGIDEQFKSARTDKKNRQLSAINGRELLLVQELRVTTVLTQQDGNSIQSAESARRHSCYRKGLYLQYLCGSNPVATLAA